MLHIIIMVLSWFGIALGVLVLSYQIGYNIHI